MLEQIVDAPPIDRITRLDIYAEGYFARLVEVLATDFEHLHRALDALFEEGAFRKLVSSYLSAHPSNTRTVADIGQHLPGFVASYAPLTNWPYLADIAKMDWLAIRTLYIDSLPAFDPQSLATLREEDWERLQFQLDTSVHLVEVQYSVDQIWNEAKFKASLVVESPRTLLIFRLGELVYVEALTREQALVLKHMAARKTLGEICEELEAQSSHEDDSFPVMEWFGRWIGNGVVRNASVDHSIAQ